MKKLFSLFLLFTFVLIVGCTDDNLQPERIIITFETNNGSVIDELIILEDEEFDMPQDPTKEGYIFEGWYEDSNFNNQYIFGSVPLEDITLYAKWEMTFQTSVSSYLEDLEFNGAVLIYKADEILISEGYGWASTEKNVKNTPETRFLIGSITKQFTAVAIMMLYEDGLLSLEDTLDMYIPGFPNGDVITIHHLLTHTSGLANYMMLTPTDDESYRKTYKSPLTLINLVWDEPLAFIPGEEFEYSNTNYLILGYILEEITGVTYQEFMQENIFNPLEMTNTGFSTLNPGPGDALGYYRIINGEGTVGELRHPSISYSSGSMASTTGDLLIWHNALMNYTLLTEETTQLMYTPHTNPVYNSDGYGYGWYIYLTEDKPKVFHSGGSQLFSTYFYRNTGSDLAIIITCNENGTDLEMILWEIFNQLTEFGH